MSLRITKVLDDRDVEWIDLLGVEILWNGGRGRERVVAVRRQALREKKARPEF